MAWITGSPHTVTLSLSHDTNTPALGDGVANRKETAVKGSGVPSQREAILMAVLVHGELYGRDIRNKFEERTKQSLPLGSLYVTLDRMEEKGFLRSRLGESNPERGGNRRKYYWLTAAGEAALDAVTNWTSTLGVAGDA